jgi:phosphinothricin acetyltransferase
MTTDTLIRHSADGDLAELVSIYNHYVENTPVTFHTTQFTVPQRIEWFTTFSKEGPYRLLVAERDGKILGYASSANYKPRAAYDTSVETTIYLDAEAVGTGVGTKLYGALIDQLVADERLHRAYGGVALPNPASTAMHERLGFELLGTYSEVGYKFDKYWDVAWYEKDLTAATRARPAG